MAVQTASKLTHTSALEVALDSAAWLKAADLAAVQLAKSLADLLDTAALEYRELLSAMRLYADVLQSLGLSIDGRAVKPNPQSEQVTPLDEIKAAAAKRKPAAKTAKPAAAKSKPRR